MAWVFLRSPPPKKKDNSKISVKVSQVEDRLSIKATGMCHHTV